MTSPSIGLLIANLGTPDAPTPAAVRRYLGEFLWDPRIVDLPRPLWWVVLHGIILRTRPQRSAQLYRKVWGPDGAPLLSISKKQTAALQHALNERFPEKVKVALGMRYGNPSIASALRQLKEAGVERILVFPLYPQYSCTTTASTFDAIASELQSWRALPELRFINRYHDHPGYIEALAQSILQSWREREPGQKLLFSFHGTPERFRQEGDPYYDQCVETAKRVAHQLELPSGTWDVVFQSRFGREEWLRPYTDETLKSLAASGVNRVDVICPGFSADCLETLEEIAQENKSLFLESGGHDYHYIPALNERRDHTCALLAIASEHLKGWV